MDMYKPSERYHEVHWMLLHSEDLETKAKRTCDVSKVIYCCLELRNVLEMLEFHLLIASTNPTEHPEIADLAKSHRGNERANKKLKSITHKAQKFYEIVCQATNQPGVYFDVNKSNDFKIDLSQYLHTYTKTPNEMKFNSKFIQDAFPLISKVREFIKASMIKDGDGYMVKNLDFKTLTTEDKIVLQDWKDDKIDEEELKKRILVNITSRKNGR